MTTEPRQTGRPAAVPAGGRSLGRLLATSDELGPRFVALNSAGRRGRALVIVGVMGIALVAGWGDRRLLAIGLVAAVLAIGAVARLQDDVMAWSRRAECVALTAWSVGIVALATALEDPATGVYYHAPLAIVALAVTTSFATALPPRLVLVWLPITAAAVGAVGARLDGLVAETFLTPLGMLVMGGIGMASNLARREAGLDRHDLTELARRLDPSAPTVEMAAEVVEAIAGWGRFDGVMIVGFEGIRSARVLAKAALDGDVLPFEAGESLPAGRVAYLRERAERGPWIERSPGDLVVASGRAVQAGPDHSLAYAPIVAGERAAGLIVAAARSSGSRSGIAVLADELPILVDAASLATTVLVAALARQEAEVEQRAAIAATIARRLFAPVYQPVLDLVGGHVVGFEALTRFADGTPPNQVFEQAEHVGLGLALEEVTMAAAVASSNDLPAGTWLSLNLSPSFLLCGRAAPILTGQSRRLVLELTEHVAIEDYAELRGAIAELGPNVRLAVDDAGAGFASLRHVIELEPDIIKLDLALVRGIDADGARQALLSSLCHFAIRTNARLLAEGIETPAELDTIRSLGIGLGQGYLLGRPAALEVAAATPALPARHRTADAA